MAKSAINSQWPKVGQFIILVGLLMLACLFFGADTPVTGSLFACLILVFTSMQLFLTPRYWYVPVVLLAAGAILIAVITDFFMERYVLARFEYITLFAGLGSLLSAYILTRRIRKPVFIWNVLLAFFAIYGVWAFIDFITSPEVVLGRERPYHEGRLAGAFLSANTAGTFFGIGVLLSTTSIVHALSKVMTLNPFVIIETLFRKASLGLFCFLISSVCLVLTASRAGICFTVVATLVFISWDFIARSKKQNNFSSSTIFKAGTVLALVTIVMFVFLWVMSGEVASSRYAEVEEDAGSRAVMYAAYWEAIMQKPLFGYGFGSFRIINMQAMTAENAHILASQGAAHNFILQWLLQVGLVGSLVAGGFVVYLFYQIVRGLSLRKRSKSYLRAILCISLFVYLHGLVDYAIEIPALMWWYAMLLGVGLGFARGRSVSRRKRT